MMGPVGLDDWPVNTDMSRPAPMSRVRTADQPMPRRASCSDLVSADPRQAAAVHRENVAHSHSGAASMIGMKLVDLNDFGMVSAKQPTSRCRTPAMPRY